MRMHVLDRISTDVRSSKFPMTIPMDDLTYVKAWRDALPPLCSTCQDTHYLYKTVDGAIFEKACPDCHEAGAYTRWEPIGDRRVSG